MDITTDHLLTADELASALNKGKAQVYKLTRDGEFDDFLVRIGEKPTYRYRPDGLADYIQRGGRKSKNLQQPIGQGELNKTAIRLNEILVKMGGPEK